jgi:hypothetical protein
MVKERAIDKAKKILKLALSAEKIGNIYEAQVAYSKIDTILKEYHMSKEDLILEETLFTKIDIKLNIKKYGKPVIVMANAISRLMGCSLLHVRGKDEIIRIYGKSNDLELFKFLFTSSVDLMLSMERSEYKKSDKRIKPGKFTRDFVCGFSFGINEKINQIIQEKEDDIKSNSNVVNSENKEYGLVLISKNLEAKKYMMDLHKDDDLSQSKVSNNKVDPDVFNGAYNKGLKHNLNKPIGT